MYLVTQAFLQGSAFIYQTDLGRKATTSHTLTTIKIKYSACMIIYLWNSRRGTGRRKYHSGCSVHSSLAYYTPDMLPQQPFQKSNVPTATVTAFYEKEGSCHSCELLLSQTEKAPELKTAVQYRVSLLKHNETPGDYNHSNSQKKWSGTLRLLTLPFFALLSTSFLHSSNFALNFCASVSVKIEYFFHQFYLLATLNTSNLEEIYQNFV